MGGYLLAVLLAASPVLAGRVVDSHGKGIADAKVRVVADDGQTTDALTDSRGNFRVPVSGKFHVEIRHDGYLSVRSSTVSLSGAPDDVYQIEVALLPGNPDQIEFLDLRLEEGSNPEGREDPNARE